MKQTAIAVLLLFVALSANGENEASQWRIGGSLSYSDYERDDGLVSDSSVGFKAHAQYRFNPWFGLEGAYYVSPDFKDDSTPNVAGGETETSYSGTTLAGIAYLPPMIDRMDFFLKGGYFNFNDVNLKVDGVTQDTGSDDGLTLGVGSSIAVDDELGIRVEFDWYDTAGADLWTIGIGAEFRF